MFETKKDKPQPERHHQKDQYPNQCKGIDYALKQAVKDSKRVK